MKSKMSLLCLAVLAAIAAMPVHAATIVASDDFEGYTGNWAGASGGSGDWAGAWSFSAASSGSSGSFLRAATGETIDGQAGAMWTDGSTITAQRNVSPITEGEIAVSWSLRARQNVSDFGVNLWGGMVDANGNSLGSRLITIAFRPSSNSGLGVRVNDGGSSFFVSGVDYSDLAIYDISFSTVVGSGAYSISVDRRGSSQELTFNGNFSNSALVDSFNQIQVFYTRSGGTGGNNVYFDNIVVAIPEPGSALLAGFGLLWLVGRRRRVSR